MHSSLAISLGLVALSCHSAPSPPSATPAAPLSVAASAAPPAPREPVPLGPLPGDVHPVREALVLDIDPARDRFGGTADIALHLDRPRDAIWLHGRGLSVRAATITTGAGPALPVRWEEVDPTGVVRVGLPSPISGDAVLHVVFDTAYDATLVGVYRVTTPAGPAVFSKFEAIYARRAFPCFDEPAYKVPFDVALTVPGSAVVVGNMPVASEATVDAGRKQVRFATTPPLPSYLIAFAVGPFDTRSTALPPSALRPQPLPIGAVAVHGHARETGHALAETPALVAEQERYFGVAFPYPKLDLIAVPDFQSGAMENAGAITFRDSALLVDDRVTALGQRIGVTNVIAHETAHQWFGDLVTMKWWDDLWLNEGFATFLATRTLRAVRPEIEAELEAAYSVNGVMSVDSLASARRIRQPIETTHDITNAFDGITYQKGAAVLTMIEHFIGDEPFRRGLHELLVAHATGNATTADLIAALAASAGKDLAPLASSFLDQPGVPVVAARTRCEGGRGRLELAQSRWRPIGSTTPDATWTIPVCVRAGIAGRVHEACTVLDAPTGTLELPGCAEWVMPNAQGAGYYRATLPPDDLARLRDRGTPRLAVVERVQLAHDLEAAFSSGALAGGDVLRALEPLARDAHGAVAMVPLSLLTFIHTYIVEGTQRASLRARVARLYAPAVAALGWTPAATDRPWRRLFRANLLAFLALEIEDPSVLAEAARRGRRLLGLDSDRTRHRDAVAPDLAELSLAAAVRTGGADVFDALLGELERSDDAQLRQRALLALASTRDPALVSRALDLALDPHLRANERLVALKPLLGALATRDAAWAWLTAHFEALAALLPDRYGGQIPAMVSMCDARRIDEVRAFFAPRIDKLTGGPRNLALALEGAQQCTARAAAQRDSVQRYLK
ncbi:MAG TPA: M1 family metallopeptidase [Kofleriaceae bacterium]|nr:M1 family metallopeptidase [Kofleriaceae bacterium]